jgi:hypothetical protein
MQIGSKLINSQIGCPNGGVFTAPMILVGDAFVSVINSKLLVAFSGDKFTVVKCKVMSKPVHQLFPARGHHFGVVFGDGATLYHDLASVDSPNIPEAIQLTKVKVDADTKLESQNSSSKKKSQAGKSKSNSVAQVQSFLLGNKSQLVMVLVLVGKKMSARPRGVR